MKSTTTTNACLYRKREQHFGMANTKRKRFGSRPGGRTIKLVTWVTCMDFLTSELYFLSQKSMSLILLIQTVLRTFSFLLLLVKYKYGSVDIDARGGGGQRGTRRQILSETTREERKGFSLCNSWFTTSCA